MYDRTVLRFREQPFGSGYYPDGAWLIISKWELFIHIFN